MFSKRFFLKKILLTRPVRPKLASLNQKKEKTFY